MKSNLIIVLILSVMSISSNCKKIEMNDDNLSLQKTLYNGKELRIDGYYYNIIPDNSIFQIYFLFQSGIIMNCGAPPLTEIENKDLILKWGVYSQNYKYSWGLFQIKKNKIKYEKWVPMEGPLFAYTYEGDIINDTTYVINEYYRNQNGKKIDSTNVNWTYHFKQFSPKPDSTNNFVK